MQRAWERRKVGSKLTEILHPNRGASPILANLIVPKREDARRQTIIKHRVMIILFVPAIAIPTTVTEIILERDVCGRIYGFLLV